MTRGGKKVILATLLFLMFVPREYAIGFAAYKAWQVLDCAVSVAATVALFRDGGVKLRWYLFTALFVAMTALSSLVSQSFGDVTSLAYNLVRLTGFVSLLELIHCQAGEDASGVVALGMAGVCVVQLVSFVVFRDVVGGMQHGVVSLDSGTEITQNYYFYTYDNESIFYIIPTIAYCLIEGMRRRLWMAVGAMLAAASMASYLYKNAVTAELALGAFLVLLGVSALLCGRGVNCRLFNEKTTTIVGLALCALVPAGLLSGALGSVAGLFGKSVTFSGREGIWLSALSSILEHPLFGIGVLSNEEATAILGITHCHNILLQLLFSGGIVALALYFAASLRCASDGANARSLGARYVSSAAIIVFYIAASMDWLYSNPAFLATLYLPVFAVGVSSSGGKNDSD